MMSIEYVLNTQFATQKIVKRSHELTKMTLFEFHFKSIKLTSSSFRYNDEPNKTFQSSLIKSNIGIKGLLHAGDSMRNPSN